MSLLFFSFFAIAQSDLQIVFSANRQGEIEPCHCQTNQIGGLSRLANYIKKVKNGFKGETFFLDSGDLFFAQPQFPESLKTREVAKAETVAGAYKLLNIDFILPGERDFAAGIPQLSTLLQSTGALFPPPYAKTWVTFVQKGKVRLGIIALLKEEPIDPFIKILQEKNVNQIVVLSHLSHEEDQRLASSHDNLLIIGSHALAGADKPEVISKSVRVETQEGGKNIGRVVFSSDNILEAKVEFVDLDKKYEGNNAVSTFLKKQAEKEKKQQISEDKKKLNSQFDKGYVANPFVCKNCHEKQFNFWKETKHASAYLVLYSKNQHFDPDCVSCHVLGFDQRGGYNKISEPIVFNHKKKSPVPFVESFLKEVFVEVGPLDSRVSPEKYKRLHDRYLSSLEKLHNEKVLKKVFIGVQCEHCHGIRNEHIQTGLPGRKPQTPETCLQCHRAPNAPAFNVSMIPLASCPKN